MLINIKSEYDFLKSLCRVGDVIDFAVANNLNSIGLCEVSNTFSAFDFFRKCHLNNIKPIYGVEVNYQNQKLLIYAKNNNGFKRLNKILSNEEISFNDIEEDLIVIVDNGIIIDKLVIDKNINYVYSFLNNFNQEDIYIGVKSHLNDKESYDIFEVCTELNLSYIYVDEIRYLKEDDLNSYLCLRAIEQQVSVSSLVELTYKRHFTKDLSNKENKYYEQFENKINLEFDKINARLLKYNEQDSKEKLHNLAFKGLTKRGFLNSQTYVDRLNYELDVIDKMGYNDYFLIVWDIVVYAHKSNILVGPGRGSAAASLVSFCLGITQIDPVFNDLLFERFLNPMRTTMPDIDLDFEDKHREDIVHYIIKRFSNGAKIATISRFLAKSAFRDIAKVNDWKNNAISVISNELDSSYSFEQNLIKNKKLTFEYERDINFRKISDFVMRIEGLARQVSIHAAGVIVSDKELNTFAVLKNNVIYQDSHTLEEIGLLKIDILAISNLTFIHNIVNRINKDETKIVLNNINLEDERTYKLLASGRTLGVFQLESAGIRNVLVKLNPKNFVELANILALYRPGPMQFIDKYLENMTKFKVHNKVDEILKISYGIIIYQEQIMEISRVVANYSLAQADILRRAISKKDEKLLLSTKEEFISKSVENGYELSYTTELFETILKFADYGFNKAHAFSYARIAYYMAYLKTYYPSVYMSEVFKQHFNNSKIDDFLIELKELDIKVLPPNILKSDLYVGALKKNIILGLTNISSINESDAKQIIKNRIDIVDKDDFLHVVSVLFKSLELSKVQVDNLVNSGAFDCFKMNRATLRFNLEKIIVKNGLSFVNYNDIELSEKEECDFETESKYELSALKINLVYDIFDLEYSKYKTKYPDIILIDNAYRNYEMNRNKYTQYKVLIKIDKIKEITTKNNQQMAFLTVSSSNKYDITVFNNVYERLNEKLNSKLNNYAVALISFNLDKINLQNIM